MQRITGILPASITPFDREGNVHVAALQEVTEYQLAQGVAGFFVCGWTGEGDLLTEAERRQVAETVIAQTRGRAVVMVHVGCPSTAATLRLAAHAQEAGADALSARLPGVYPVGSHGRVDYYAAIAGVSSLPLYVYNEPEGNATPFTPDMFRELRDTLPTLAGMKYTSRNLMEMRQFLDCEVAGVKANVLSGMEDLLLGALSMGADGSIALIYNLLPWASVELYEAFRAGRLSRAAELQAAINRVIQVWYDFYPRGGLSILKGMFTLLGFECGQGRLPQPAVSGEDLEQMRDALERAGFFQLAVAC